MRKILLTTLIGFVLLGATSGFGFSQSTASSEQVAPAEATEVHEHPSGFVSDGCTAFPDGNYRECCEEHDLDYYKGGSFSERRASDKRLYRCVKAKGGWKNKVRAPMMYLGVRLFGTAWLPTPFRWGFGKKEMKRAKEEAEKQAETAEDPAKNKEEENKPQVNQDQEN